MKFFEPGFRKQVKELIAEDQGINPSNFLNVEIFKLEIQKRITEAGEDSAKLVEKVREEVATVLDEIILSCFGEFPELAQQIQLTSRDELADLQWQTQTQIDKMLKVEANFIYQRKGYYEVILAKIATAERERAKNAQGTDELKQRVAAMESQPRLGAQGGFGSSGSFGGSGFGSNNSFGGGAGFVP